MAIEKRINGKIDDADHVGKYHNDRVKAESDHHLKDSLDNDEQTYGAKLKFNVSKLLGGNRK